MGAIGDFIGGVFDAVGGMFGAGSDDQLEAQREANQIQREAMERQNQLAREQAATQKLQMEQANNRARADVANAAAAIKRTPTVTNESNLTGGLGVPTSELTLGGNSTLGGR